MNINENMKVEQEQHRDRNMSRKRKKNRAQARRTDFIKERNIGRVGKGPKGKGRDKEGEMASFPIQIIMHDRKYMAITIH